MLVTICERVSDVRHSTEAAHGQWIVSLDPADTPGAVGYAKLAVAAPVARLGGVGVVLGGAFAPDPIQIRVVEREGPGLGLQVLRSRLPAMVDVDQIRGVVRLIRSRAVPFAETIVDAADDAIEGRPGDSTGEEE